MPVAWKPLPVLILVLSPFAACAQTRTWEGATDPWNVPGNWSGSAVPTFSNFAVIDNGGTATLGVGVSGTADSLSVGYSGTGSLNVSGETSQLSTPDFAPASKMAA